MLMDDSSVPYQSKLFKAVLLYLTIKGGLRLAIGGTVLALATFVFCTIVDATIELSQHIGAVWASSSPIERLIILVLAVLFIRMLSPVAVRLYRKGQLR